MLRIILIGCTLIVATSIVHTLASKFAFDVIQSRRYRNTNVHRIITIDFIILITILATLFEASLWSLLYLITGAIEVAEEALYFSLVTYTTLGYGDIVLPQGIRLLAGFEAANGVIVFGWSTAIVVTALQRVYPNK